MSKEKEFRGYQPIESLTEPASPPRNPIGLKEIKKILLKADDFKMLISGKILSKDGVEIALADFGYIKMLEIIAKEMDE